MQTFVQSNNQLKDHVVSFFCISAHKDVQSAQVKEHRTAVLDFIEDYLKSVWYFFCNSELLKWMSVFSKEEIMLS